jgi:hypothetical protein
MEAIDHLPPMHRMHMSRDPVPMPMNWQDPCEYTNDRDYCVVLADLLDGQSHPYEEACIYANGTFVICGENCYMKIWVIDLANNKKTSEQAVYGYILLREEGKKEPGTMKVISFPAKKLLGKDRFFNQPYVSIPLTEKEEEAAQEDGRKRKGPKLVKFFEYWLQSPLHNSTGCVQVVRQTWDEWAHVGISLLDRLYLNDRFFPINPGIPTWHRYENLAELQRVWGKTPQEVWERSEPLRCLLSHHWHIMCGGEQKQARAMLMGTFEVIRMPNNIQGKVFQCCGEQGAGKSLENYFISQVVLLGASTFVTNSRDLVGDFQTALKNGHPHYLVEEIDLSDSKSTAQLNILTAMPTITVNEKFKAPYEVPAAAHIVTNSNKKLTAAVDGKGRRHCICTVVDRINRELRKPDGSPDTEAAGRYFTRMAKEVLTNECADALVALAYAIDMDPWLRDRETIDLTNRNRMAGVEATLESWQKGSPADKVAYYWYEVLSITGACCKATEPKEENNLHPDPNNPRGGRQMRVDGRNDPVQGQWDNHKVRMKELYEYATNNKLPSDVTLPQFSAETIRIFGFERTECKSYAEYRLHSKDKCIELFKRARRIDIISIRAVQTQQSQAVLEEEQGRGQYNMEWATDPREDNQVPLHAIFPEECPLDLSALSPISRVEEEQRRMLLGSG